MWRVFSLALVLLMYTYSPAQTYYEKGYLVNEKGDTIRGEVKLNQKKPVEIYNKLTFRDEKGVQKNYKPEKVLSYGFSGRHFIKLDYGGEEMYYEVLCRGPINFYKLVFEAMYTKEVSLEPEYYLNRIGSKKVVVVKTNKFKKQLSDWMEDNPEFINGYVEEKEFSEAKAREVIEQYNTWKVTH
ncbi:MAG TPA: hypothetical protein PLQ93_00280 [Bacteroidia bacterium]|nr:hypothetical protein [Bacteroidia bacterium]